MTPKLPLSNYVSVDTSDQRLSRVWDGVAERIERARPGSWRFRSRLAMSVGAIAIVASVAAVVLTSERHSPSAWQGATLETASDTLRVDLEDGSRLSLEAHTRVAVEESSDDAVIVNLSRGQVHCDVAPNRTRRFAVLARGVRVSVTGTRFSVRLDQGARVSVAVESGTVEVTAPGARTVRSLSAGERWSIDSAVTAGRGDAWHERGAAPEPSAREAEADPAPVEPSHDDGSPSPRKSSSAAPSAPVVDARSLFEQGTEARRAGDARQAARYYEQLLQRYPSDPRAGLAAFELGRLRMDRLGDLQGAVSALRRAVALAPGSGFREDAMARLVQAYAAMGAVERCRQARRSYLAAFPSGVHANSVAQICPEP